MLVVAEKKLKNVKVLAITCVDGNTTMENVIKNTWRILNGNQRSEVIFLPSLKFDKKSLCFKTSSRNCSAVQTKCRRQDFEFSSN